MKSHKHLVEISIFFLKMPPSDLPKLWTVPTKIGHIFRKWNILEVKINKIFVTKSWSPSPNFFNKFFLERFDQFSTLNNNFKIRILKCLKRLFIFLVTLTVTLIGENPNFHIHSFKSNSIKKSWQDSKQNLLQPI